MLKLNPKHTMTLILILLITWSLLGFIYFGIDTFQSLDMEATLSPDAPQSIWKSLAFGPTYWLLYALIYVSSQFLK